MRVLHGPLRKPIKAVRAASFARITIARVQDPTPEAGHVPAITGLKVSWMQRCVSDHACESYRLAEQCTVSDKIRREPAKFIDRLEQRANDQMAVIQSLRDQRALLEHRLAQRNLSGLSLVVVDSKATQSDGNGSAGVLRLGGVPSMTIIDVSTYGPEQIAEAHLDRMSQLVPDGTVRRRSQPKL